MAKQTCMGALMKCSFGMAPSSLIPTPKTVMSSSMVAANILDHKPLMNIMPFGACQSLANPMVASATAAAMGVLTPMPCIPMTMAPWVPGAPTVLLCGSPALNDSSKLMCNWGGVIAINMAGQMTHDLP
ncbi:conserved hypothetical protein [Rubrivivax sp. A210]|uniref:DUF4280 domain-containing protein n=1 Tax=Rubrivivax sp. A210 TaxID=2772301 RepID=UPI001918AECC|nr:DUF4280 domain-containing protein [Rubrivivax sp. A210]CAD5369294.1 conserved hypothetical protein [Rubrivivax sp. A210]